MTFKDSKESLTFLQRIPKDLKAALFDCDGTLLSLTRPISAEYGDLITRFGFTYSPSSLGLIIKETWYSMEDDYLNVKEDFSTTQEKESNFWHNFAASVVTAAIGRAPPLELVSAIYQRYAEVDTRVINDGVGDALLALKRSGIALGILTNNDSRTKKIISNMEIGILFDHVFTAGDLGWKKPSQRCFKRASEILNSSPQEMLYVGDDLDRDIIPALNSGFHALLYNPQKKDLPPGVNDFQFF